MGVGCGIRSGLRGHTPKMSNPNDLIGSLGPSRGGGGGGVRRPKRP